MSIGAVSVCVILVVDATAGADERLGFVGGGDDLDRRLLAQLVDTCRDADTARLS